MWQVKSTNLQDIQDILVKFSQDLTYQKLLKSVNFWQSYSKNKNGRFCGHRVCPCHWHYLRILCEAGSIGMVPSGCLFHRRRSNPGGGAARRAAANESRATFTAGVGSRMQTCYFLIARNWDALQSLCNVRTHVWCQLATSLTKFTYKLATHLSTSDVAVLYKKLSYRRSTARCVVSVEILPTATQQCRNYLYDKSWTDRSYAVGGLQSDNA